MGGGRWSDDDYADYATKTNYVAAARHEVFSQSLKAGLDPRYVKVGAGPRAGQQLRESCDSPENPNSTPIILGLDVTGSMGAVAEQIAKIELPKLMTGIHESKPVVDPHIMFMGIDDVFAQGHGALQVSQFEPDIRIVEQLRDMWLVGNGGGNGSESYDLAWYFAAHYTATDAYEKRRKKGFLFTFGDEPAPYQTVRKEHLARIFGPGDYEDTTPAASLEAAKRKYHVFHVHCRGVEPSWDSLLENNSLRLRNPAYLTPVVLATLAIVNGADMEQVIKDSDCPAELRYAFANSLSS